MQLIGVDFTSAPRRAKPITVARGRLAGACVVLERSDALESFEAFDALLGEPGPWLGAFDLPLGLPRELVGALGWPMRWLPLMRHYGALTREQVRATFAAFCASRPAGSKYAHRACEAPAGASPAMKWTHPPVALMLHAAAPRLIDAGVHLPGLHEGDRGRVVLEGYPGLLARELIGRRPYKSDERARQTPERLIARKDLLGALEQGRSRLGLRVKLSPAQSDRLLADARGDQLDAVLCLVQAAWASTRPGFGLPVRVDPLEGWITGA